MFNYLSLFSGIGAFESALTNLNIEYNITNFCEIDKYASLCYSNMHHIDISKNLGDITKVDVAKLDKDITLLTHGSPCQDFSVSGKGKGGDENSGTRSSLLWNSVNIIANTMPKVIIWENVKNVLSAKHIHNFNKYLSTLDCLGYNNYYKIFNSKNFDLPQNRERIFVVSIRKDIETNFSLDNIEQKKTTCTIEDFIYPVTEIEEKYFVKRNMKKITQKKVSDIISIGQVSNNGSQAGKVYDISGIFPTICACTHGYAIGYIYQNEKVRMLIPEETFKMMGFSKQEFDICKNLGMKDTQLYKMAGNSIAVPILYKIFQELVQNKILN